MKASLRKITALMGYQFKTIIKTPGMLLTIVMSPLMYIGLSVFFKMSGETTDHSSSMMGMYTIMGLALEIGLLPTLVASIIAEEKEKNTLRVLMLSSVSAFEYIGGLALAILSIEIIMLAIFYFAMGISLSLFATLMLVLITIITSLISIILGAILGVYCKNRSNVQTLSLISMALTLFGVGAVFFLPQYDVLLNVVFTAPFGRLLKMLFIDDGNFTNLDLIIQVAISAIHLVIYPIIFNFLYKKNSWDK